MERRNADRGCLFVVGVGIGQAALRKLADKMTAIGRKGIYTNEQRGAIVATDADAPTRQTHTCTKPMTSCGYPSFWSGVWEPSLD